MMRSAIIAAALALALPAQAEPPFSANDSGATKVLKFVAWAGSLDDISQSTSVIPEALGYSAPPQPFYADIDGKHILDWTEYLSSAPVWTGAKSAGTYTVMEADGPARSHRATIEIRLNSAEACITMTDMIARFGDHPRLYPTTDGGPISYDWVLRQTPYKTIVDAVFGPTGKSCAPGLMIIEAR